ncbi:hypothetical protein [Corynebacterium doosanense]|uniref:Cation:proton antiporter n=1 Tax=Corynebacterium doosanense CAU 212 = DSM 45436 TaxID=558173 RepID=A0A097IDB3_9CORY|nr:hypothetical protein [Corynebacterium doosanense]AIT60117.1 cation:proton antiporter [Corynebacterium doosanense CAU 212 = DSM 45436]
MSIFEWILLGSIGVIALSMLSGLVLILRTADMLSRAVLSDLIFYSMIVLYLIWTIPNETYIGYEIAILAGIVGGVMPTLSMSRIITRGRR